MMRCLRPWAMLLALATAGALAQAPAGQVEVAWLGQPAFKITSPDGKVIVSDPWLRGNPLTPPGYRKRDAFGKIDVLLVSHGHLDHIADASAKTASASSTPATRRCLATCA